jgi:hypothetical protein
MYPIRSGQVQQGSLTVISLARLYCAPVNDCGQAIKKANPAWLMPGRVRVPDTILPGGEIFNLPGLLCGQILCATSALLVMSVSSTRACANQ